MILLSWEAENRNRPDKDVTSEVTVPIWLLRCVTNSCVEALNTWILRLYVPASTVYMYINAKQFKYKSKIHPYTLYAHPHTFFLDHPHTHICLCACLLISFYQLLDKSFKQRWNFINIRKSEHNGGGKAKTGTFTFGWDKLIDGCNSHNPNG